MVFTAYDANSVMCLNLRDGEIIWEATRSSEDLYIAGIFDNNVVVVSDRIVAWSFDQFAGLPAIDRLALAPESV